MRHLARIFIVASSVLVPVSALAQSDDAGRLEDTLLSGEDRDDTRLGEEAFLSRFQGLFAVDGECGDHESVWAFAPGSVTAGRTICTSLGKMTWEDEGLLIPMSQCSEMGEDRDDRTIAVSEADDGIMVDVDGEELRLTSCQ